MLIFCFCQCLENQRPKLWGWVGNLKFCHMMYIYKMVAIFWFFHNGQHPHFPLVQFLYHHAISSLVQFSTFKHDDVSALKIFMGGPLQHSCMMTFLYLKVHNGWHKFSIGSVSSTPSLFQHSCMMTFLHSQKVPRKFHKNRLTHSCPNQPLRRFYESPINKKDERTKDK